MDEAWEAVLDDKLHLAEKLARRAIDGSEMNPRLWLDLGRILLRCEQRDDAEEALRRAIAIAPTHGEAFAELAGLQAAAGKWVQAERLQRRAVELLPHDPKARQLLDSYTAMLPTRSEAPRRAGDEVAFTALTERFAWDEVAQEMRRSGLASLPALISADECASLRALWDEECFEHRVREDSDERGRVEYRFFFRPLPKLVEALRSELYARLAPIANEWQQALQRSTRFPPTLAEFLEECRLGGQHRTTPILLRYAEGGFNGLHRDIAGRIFFPFQLAVTLGPRTDGGDFRLVDVRTGRRLRERRIATGPGCGVVFCTNERLVEVGGLVAAQSVQHGVSECGAERFALGVPFHEHG